MQRKWLINNDWPLVAGPGEIGAVRGDWSLRGADSVVGGDREKVESGGILGAIIVSSLPSGGRAL